MDVTREWIGGLPKVELHVHLEGATSPGTLLRLAEKNGVALPFNNIDDLKSWYKFTDFAHFFKIYQKISESIVSIDDLHQITLDFLAEQARQQIRHSEVTFTALTHYNNNCLPFVDQMAAIREAAQKAKEIHGISMGLIIDITRGMATPEEVSMVARWVADGFGDGFILALGLTGYEEGFRAEDFIRPLAVCAEAGVPMVIHAGENGPAASIRHAVEGLNAIRIGHGVAAAGDASTIALLKERGTTIEACPSSNICLKVVDCIDNHPFDQLHKNGVKITINSDDPPIFNSDLNSEYFAISKAFGYSCVDMAKFSMLSVDAALLSDGEKDRILRESEVYIDKT